jgi:hypothetical protein
MKKISSKTINVLIVFLFLLLTFFPKTASLAYNFSTGSGLSQTAARAGYPDQLNVNPESLISKGIGLVLSFVGVLFLLLLIYGGYTWMMAQGVESEVTKAKKVITTAIIGLIIVFGAYAISYFIVSYFSSQTLS